MCVWLCVYVSVRVFMYIYIYIIYTFKYIVIIKRKTQRIFQSQTWRLTRSSVSTLHIPADRRRHYTISILSHKARTERISVEPDACMHAVHDTSSCNKEQQIYSKILHIIIMLVWYHKTIKNRLLAAIGCSTIKFAIPFHHIAMRHITFGHITCIADTTQVTDEWNSL